MTAVFAASDVGSNLGYDLLLAFASQVPEDKVITLEASLSIHQRQLHHELGIDNRPGVLSQYPAYAFALF